MSSQRTSIMHGALEDQEDAEIEASVSNEVLLTSLRQLVGRTFHEQYLLEDVLGEGAMGVVFRAKQSGLGRHVALKLMKSDSMDAEEDGLERFESETHLVANLSHPNIVRLFDSGFEPSLGVYYVAMELIEGMALGDVVEKQRCHPALALEVLYQVCSGLTEPHTKQIVHRDLKPDNIFLRLRSDGALEVKILDFGIARALHSNARITRTGMILGTPAYMAPELAVDSDIDARTDLYALGIILFEMLTGNIPHRASVPVKILMKHINEPVPSIASIDPEFNYPKVQKLIDDLLSKDIEARPESAFAVCERIDEIRQAYDLPVKKLDPSLGLKEAMAHWILEPVDPEAFNAPTDLSKEFLKPERHTESQRAVVPEPPTGTAVMASIPSLPYVPGQEEEKEENSKRLLLGFGLVTAAIVIAGLIIAAALSSDPPEPRATAVVASPTQEATPAATEKTAGPKTPETPPPIEEEAVMTFEDPEEEEESPPPAELEKKAASPVADKPAEPASKQKPAQKTATKPKRPPKRRPPSKKKNKKLQKGLEWLNSDW